MKKDTYPNVKIEIISEGLAKKILGKLENGSPSVYGEEKPTGENLPDIDSKGKNKEMGGLLQVSNKKPTYTSIIKQAIQELRKAPEDQYGQFQPGLGSKGKAGTQGIIQRYSDLTPDQQDTSKKLAYERPEDVRDIQSQEASAMAGAGQTRTREQDLAQRLSDPTLQRKVRSDYREMRGKEGAFGSEAPGVKEIDSKAIIKQAILELRKEPEGGSSAPLRRTPEMVRQVASSNAKTTPGKSLLNRRPEVYTPPQSIAQEEGSDETPSSATSTPLAQSESVKTEAARTGFGSGSSTRRMDSASAPPSGRDFDMARGPGRKKGLNPKNYTPGGTSFEENAISKAQNSKSITAKPTANVNGVNVSSTVVSGAGTMQKGKIKAERSVPARTRPKKRVPKLIKSERPAMDNTLRYIIKEAIEEMQIEKAPKKGRNLPSKGRQFSQTDADTGRGATSFIQERKKSRDMGSRLGPQRRDDVPSFDEEGNYTGANDPAGVPLGTQPGGLDYANRPRRKATGGSAESYRGNISNMAKQALIKKGMVWDVRNHNWVSIEKQESDVDTFSSRRLNYSDPSKPDTRMSDTGPDEYGDPNKYIPPSIRDADAEVQSTASRRKGIKSQAASASGGTPQSEGASPRPAIRSQDPRAIRNPKLRPSVKAKTFQ